MFCTEESDQENKISKLEKRDSLIMATSQLEPKQLVLSRVTVYAVKPHIRVN